MKQSSLWALLACCWASACTSDLALTLEGKQCQGPDGRCLGGFVCHPQTNLCVRPEQLASAGGAAAVLGGPPGEGGAAGFPGSGGQRFLAEDTDAGQDRGAGGEPAGSGGMPSVLVAGGGPRDAGDDAPDTYDAASVDACVPTLLYPDGDGDEVGLTSAGTLRCPAPGWVSAAGDCRDDQPRVFLGQEDFSALSFPDPTKPDQVSFDFDCSGTEVADPGNTALDAPPESCALRIPCAGSGFLPRDPTRVDTGVEPRCGSNRLRSCIVDGLLNCVLDDQLVPPQFAFRCR